MSETHTAESSTSLLPDAFNPFDPEIQQNPAPWYSAMRASGPVHYVPAANSWFVVTKAAIEEALRRPDIFSSRMNATLRNAPSPEAAEAVAEIQGQGWPEEQVLLTSDPPEHDRQRTLFSKAFTPRRVKELEPEIHAEVDRLFDGLPAEQTVEFVSRFAVPLPTLIIARMLNIPDERASDFKRWSDARSSNVGNKPDAATQIQRAQSELERQQYFAEQIDARRREPRDDLITAMVHARLGPDDDTEGEPLTTSEMLSILGQLMNAGNETTTKLLTGAAHILGSTPDLWRWLQEDPVERASPIIEECLRILTPVQALPRITTQDTELEGVAIPAGSNVFLAYASANHDGGAFDDPDQVDTERKNVREHLSFGHGVHYCLGAALARLEGRIAVQRLAERFEAIELAPTNRYEYLPSFILRGLKELHVTLRPR